MKARTFNLIKGKKSFQNSVSSYTGIPEGDLSFITQFAKKNSTLNLKTDMKYEESNHTLICFRRRVSLSPVLSFHSLLHFQFP